MHDREGPGRMKLGSWPWRVEGDASQRLPGSSINTVGHLPRCSQPDDARVVLVPGFGIENTRARPGRGPFCKGARQSSSITGEAREILAP